MKRTDVWRMTAIAGLILLLGLSPFQAVSGQTSYSDINIISVDQHWIDITQLDDPDAFRVDEFVFINNTGSAPFGGSVQVWLPENSQISAECCGGVADMACRYHEDGLMECFYFLPMDGNRYVGYPFENSPNLSYYGQEVEMTLSAISETNASNEDSINMTAILGSPAIARTNDLNASGGIGIVTNDEVIGLTPILDMYMPYNITAHENITLTNNGAEDDTFSLGISELPDGWGAYFWNETGMISNITIEANGTRELFLNITAPSYMAPIYLSYTMEFSASDNGGIGAFEKQYIYDNDYVEYYLFLLTEEGMQDTTLTSVHPGSGDAPSWDEGSQRFWSVLMGVELDNNSTTNIDLNIQDIQLSSSGRGGIDIGMLLVLIGVIVLAAIMIIALRRPDNEVDDEYDSKDASDEDHESRTGGHSGDRKTRLLEEIAMFQELIERVDSDRENGLLSREAALKMKDTYENKITGAEEAIQELEANNVKPVDDELSELASRKKKVLLSIRRIEMELEEGLIGQDDFDKFNEAYREKAKEIIRQIDEMNNQ